MKILPWILFSISLGFVIYLLYERQNLIIGLSEGNISVDTLYEKIVELEEVKPEPEPEPESIFLKWESGSFVDNFGDPTDKRYIYTKSEGTFSNSAVSNEYLLVQVLVTGNSAGIFLYEHGNKPPEKIIGTARIQMKNSIGNTITVLSVSEWNQEGGIKLSNLGVASLSKFINFLKSATGEIKDVIYDEYSSSYLFIINAEGFIDSFAAI